MKKALLSFLTIAILSAFSSAAFAQNNTIAAMVNGEKILKTEVSQRIWINHFEKTINTMIDETLLLQEAKNLKIKVSKKEIDKRLKEVKAAYTNKKDFEAIMANMKKEVREKIEYELRIKKTIIKAKKISFTNKNVKKVFTENKKNFDKPEEIRLRQIFVNSEKDAQDAHLALEAGADFAKLSSLKSTQENLKKNGGDLGYVSKSMLVKEISEAISLLKKGQYTKPIKIADGYTLLKLEDIKKPEAANFNKIKAQLKESMINQSVMKNLPILIKELRGKSKIEIMK
ncbi:MAG: peptidyl-prolyl cis-trans isomerase [Elusimicrobiales bacterium]|nr:peptidyl-prolyl cis-trans isomerase [Elusimicrobiales bacterium]MCK5358293.1 peptidyl-prolyl cis-trans isomerase [Elusimicrobiales bacterium]